MGEQPRDLGPLTDLVHIRESDGELLLRIEGMTVSQTTGRLAGLQLDAEAPLIPLSELLSTIATVNATTARGALPDGFEGILSVPVDAEKPPPKSTHTEA